MNIAGSDCQILPYEFLRIQSASSTHPFTPVSELSAAMFQSQDMGTNFSTRFRVGEVTLSPPLLYLVAHLPINTFAKTFWILLCREVRAQKIIHDTLCFSASHGFIWHFLSCVWNSTMFLLCFINYLTQIAPFFFFSVFFFRYLFVTSHTLHFTLFTSTLTLFRSSFSVFKFCKKKKRKEENIYKKS